MLEIAIHVADGLFVVSVVVALIYLIGNALCGWCWG